MKHLLIFLFPAIFLFYSSDFPDFNQLVGALKKSDAKELAQFFDATVDLTLPDKSSSYSKTQAQMVLRDFFKANPVSSFDIVYRNETQKSIHCVGNLYAGSSLFRATLLLKNKGGRAVLQELRIEKPQNK